MFAAAAFMKVAVKRDNRLAFNLHDSFWADNQPLFHSGFDIVRVYLAGLVKSRVFSRGRRLRIAHRFALRLSAHRPVEEKAWL
jgi:hypothetical protein